MVQSLFMSFKVTDKIAPSPNTKLRLLLSYFHCLVEPLRVDSVPVLRPKWNRQYSLFSTIPTLLENVNRIEKVERNEKNHTIRYKRLCYKANWSNINLWHRQWLITWTDHATVFYSVYHSLPKPREEIRPTEIEAWIC